MSDKHLSQTERYQIYALMKAGHLPVEIAKLLGRHKSSISRALSRNTGKRGYRPQQADQRYRERAQCSRNARRIGEAIRALVAELLSLQWSPEQIAASLPISHETIYQHVYADKAQGGSRNSVGHAEHQFARKSTGKPINANDERFALAA
jgi:transposase, IS30 family